MIPTPFGFGIWTSHTTPIHLGATTVRIERFDPVATCAAIAHHQATVLCCVSTQLMMILANPRLAGLRPDQPAGRLHRR